jgi:hypothetical protein
MAADAEATTVAGGVHALAVWGAGRQGTQSLTGGWDTACDEFVAVDGEAAGRDRLSESGGG